MIKCVRKSAGIALCGFVILGCGSNTPVGAIPLVATHLAFDNQPAATLVSPQPLGTVSVRILNSAGQLATDTSYTVTIALSTPDTGARLSGTTTAQSGRGGVATFGDLTVARAGTDFKLVARVTGLDSAMSQPFTVTRGPASKLKFDFIGEEFPGNEIPAIVRIVDAGGNVVPDATSPVTLSVARTASNGFTVAPDENFAPLTVMPVTGAATFHGLVVHKTGLYTLTASSPGLPTVTFDEGIGAWNITRLIFVTQPSDGNAAQVLPAVSVRQVDDYGNAAFVSTPHFPNPLPVSISLSANSTGAALSGTVSQQADAFGPANFSDLKIDKPGTYSFIVTWDKHIGTGKFTVTSAPFTVK